MHVIRVDASFLIGSGHVMRCLTLADELRQQGSDVAFVCREHAGNLIALIEGKGYPVMHLQQLNGYVSKPDDLIHAEWLGVSWQQDALETINALGNTQPQWLIVDHYALDHRWEKELRPYADKIMVIDDLADRPHDCDLLLDQNLYLSMETRYENLVPGNCRKLLGPKYALLRPEFSAARKSLPQRDGHVRRILVFFGGVDPTNETEKALHALISIFDQLVEVEVDVVVGGRNTHKEQIQNICATHEGFHYHCQVDNMAELMAAADLAIGAGGSTTWERCSLALPSITMIIAYNQRETTAAVAAAGAALNLGWYENVNEEVLAAAVSSLLQNASALREMGRQALSLFGDGSIEGGRALAEIIWGNKYADS